MTPEQIKAKLREQGITITEWAKQHGYPREAVYRTLNGVEKATFGRSHRIAVDLGLKPKPASSSVHAA
jgi:gp16 family phage-associated protein